MVESKLPAKGAAAPITVEVPNIEITLPNEKLWEYQNRIVQSQINRGSRYPPFSIEPLAFERQRTVKWMTPEDRFLRKQWLHDQHLAPGEPVFVEGAKPLNIFRRIFRIPMDMLEYNLAKLVGMQTAHLTRVAIVVTSVQLTIFAYAYYNFAYNSDHKWEKMNLFHLYGSRRKRYPEDDLSQLPADPPNFAHKGFYDRKVLLNAKTSAADNQ